MECFGAIPTLAALTTILSAIGAIIAVVCFVIAILLLRQMFYIEDLLGEVNRATQMRITSLSEVQRRLVAGLQGQKQTPLPPKR